MYTSTAVYETPDPLVDLDQISPALTSNSEVSFLVSIQIPGLPDPVSALIDAGATSNHLSYLVLCPITFALPVLIVFSYIATTPPVHLQPTQ